MKTNSVVFFKIIPKSQFALLILPVNLYFINNECAEWSFLKLNEKKFTVFPNTKTRLRIKSMKPTRLSKVNL